MREYRLGGMMHYKTMAAGRRRRSARQYQWPAARDDDRVLDVCR